MVVFGCKYGGSGSVTFRHLHGNTCLCQSVIIRILNSGRIDSIYTVAISYILFSADEQGVYRCAEPHASPTACLCHCRTHVQCNDERAAKPVLRHHRGVRCGKDREQQVHSQACPECGSEWREGPCSEDCTGQWYSILIVAAVCFPSIFSNRPFSDSK